MPYYAHIEQYETTELRSNRAARRIKWRVVEENLYSDYKKVLTVNLNTLWAAECFCNGWNLCIDALLNEREVAS